MNSISDCLRAWEPLVASNCQVPAASSIMFEAAELIEKQQAEIERLKLPPIIEEHPEQDICRDRQASDVLYNASPDCDGIIVSAIGGGVRCTKCRGWFCY